MQKNLNRNEVPQEAGSINNMRNEKKSICYFLPYRYHLRLNKLIVRYQNETIR